jgi:nucleolar protein 53
MSRLKSIKRELKAEEALAAENEEKRKAAKEEKMSGPLKLSNYNYEPQEIEIKLSDELTGNLRNVEQEGSLLEDRFKSMQRRNMIEVRVKQKTVKRLKRKTFEKRSHKMGWEENPNRVAKRIRQETKLRQKRRKQPSS